MREDLDLERLLSGNGFGLVDEKIVDQARTHVLQALDFGPTDVDDIIRETGCPAGAVHVVLLELEIAGRLVRQAGNSVSLVLP